MKKKTKTVFSTSIHPLIKEAIRDAVVRALKTEKGVFVDGGFTALTAHKVDGQWHHAEAAADKILSEYSWYND